MPLINCKVEQKREWTKSWVLSVAGNENNINENANALNIIFTIKDTKLYVPKVILSAKINQKLSKLLRQGFEDQLIGMNIKQKVVIKMR